ncbi:hypothetical protein [Arenibaculum pallidiluteum]|uniref:hypothetical protein n=1 Tax=Arenibaculum pallidiluteum TaxID=2812559 RepID=UPI001A957D47|nr:hypothetical protein [Arenibaculum pallidiluteum]
MDPGEANGPFGEGAVAWAFRCATKCAAGFGAGPLVPVVWKSHDDLPDGIGNAWLIRHDIGVFAEFTSWNGGTSGDISATM